MAPIILVILVRIIAVIVGGVSMYFGYRLLMKERGKSKGKGTITLPGDISIDLRRVGPGVFFALFGAIVVGVSLWKTTTYTETTTTTPGGEHSTVTIVGAGSALQIGLDDAQELLRSDMVFLNQTLPTVLQTDLSPQEMANVELDIEQLKLDLMMLIWDEEWGDYEEFEALVQSGSLDEAPPELQEAADYFRQGQEQ